MLTAQVAKKMGRTELAIRARAHGLGLHKVVRGAKRPDVWACAEQIVQSYWTGTAVDALAAQHKTSSQTIFNILDDAGCESGGPHGQWERRRKTVGGVTYTQCTKCKKWKRRTAEFFGRRARHSPDGMCPQCRDCEQDARSADPLAAELRRLYVREHHRRTRRALWAARWRVAAEQLLNTEEKNDG